MNWQKFKLNKREGFIVHMLFYMLSFIFIFLTINARPYTMAIMFVLFAWIIVKEFIDYFRGGHCVKFTWPMIIKHKTLHLKAIIMEFQLHEDEVLPFRLGKPINSDGEEAPIQDGSLLLAVSDPAIFTVEQDDENPDDPEARMFVPHAEGSAVFTATADADLGDGVEEIKLEVTGTIISGAAVGFGPILFGTPRKKKV